MLDADALAAILDPERKVPGWWLKVCSNCGIDAKLGYRYGSSLPITVCKRCGHFLGLPNPFDRLVSSENDYTGPPDLHTAREHNWRLEDWLEARGYGWRRNWYGHQSTLIADSDGFAIYSDKDHTAAIVAAIERIANEQKR